MRLTILLLTLTVLGCGQTERREVPPTGTFFAPAPPPRVYADFDAVRPLFLQDDDTTYVINFWATWCRPCLEELPLLEALQTKHRQDALRVLLVSLDDEPAAIGRIPEFLAARGTTLPTVVVTDTTEGWQRALDEKWDGSLPTTIIYRGALRYVYRRNFLTLQDAEAAVEPLVSQ